MEKFDFYNLINDEWLKNNDIPNDHIKWSEFNIINKKNDEILKNIILLNQDDVHDDKKELFHCYYDSYINKKNDKKILYNFLNYIINLKTLDDIIECNAHCFFVNSDVLFSIVVDENIFDSKYYMCYLTQKHIGLPNKKYYIDGKYQNIRDNYYIFMSKIIKSIYVKLTDKQIQKICDKIYVFEFELANILDDNETLRDIQNNIKLFNYDELVGLFDNLNIDKYFKKINQLLKNKNNDAFDKILLEGSINVNQNYFYKLNKLIKKKSLNDIKYLMIWSYLLNNVSSFDEKYAHIFYEFYGKLLRGQKNIKSIEDRAFGEIKDKFGDLLTQYYIKNNYNDNTTKYMIIMINNVMEALRESIKQLKWMSKKTKKKALLKLSKFNYKIGYSNKVLNYNSIALIDNYYVNNITLNAFLLVNKLKKINKQRDNDEWSMDEFEVNAYYNYSNNEIVFPAGILQDPFLNLNTNDAINYAKIGSIIGHEIIHGFDDQGRLFDENGNLNIWWEKKDDIEYKKIVNKLINLYNKHGVNGELTIGENIADIGGIKLSLMAYEKSKNNNVSDDEYKLFFKSFAELWRAKITDNYLDEMHLNDPHSPPWHRVNITLKNMPKFNEIYKTGIDDKDIIAIW